MNAWQLPSSGRLTLPVTVLTQRMPHASAAACPPAVSMTVCAWPSAMTDRSPVGLRGRPRLWLRATDVAVSDAPPFTVLSTLRSTAGSGTSRGLAEVAAGRMRRRAGCGGAGLVRRDERGRFADQHSNQGTTVECHVAGTAMYRIRDAHGGNHTDSSLQCIESKRYFNTGIWHASCNY